MLLLLLLLLLLPLVLPPSPSASSDGRVEECLVCGLVDDDDIATRLPSAERSPPTCAFDDATAAAPRIRTAAVARIAAAGDDENVALTTLQNVEVDDDAVVDEAGAFLREIRIDDSLVAVAVATTPLGSRHCRSADGGGEAWPS